MLRADLHTHTHFSLDGVTEPAAFVRRCVAAGLTAVAVTDHNTVEGAYAVAAVAPFRVIIGEEVRARGGELIGLFLEESVPAGLSLQESADRIHRQGGLVVAPHPFDPLRPSLGGRGLRSLGRTIDVVEGYNGRMALRRCDRQARAFAVAHSLPVSLGSDAHCGRELGRSYLELPDFDGPRDLPAALRQAAYHPAPWAPWLLPASGWALARWALGIRPRPVPRTGSQRP